MRVKVGKETPQNEKDLNEFLWRHTWHFSALLNFKKIVGDEDLCFTELDKHSKSQSYGNQIRYANV